MRLKIKGVLVFFITAGLLLACGGPTEPPPAEDDHAHEEEGHAHEDEHDQEHEDHADEEMLVLPELTAVELGDRKLRVVATTSIIGDVVAQVGGEAIQLDTLMTAGQDPHSYQPSARSLTAVADADVIFVNGWGLEESLLEDIAQIAENGVIVPISAGIEPLEAGEHAHEHEGEHEEHEEEDHADEEHDHDEDEHEHGPVDPHVWFMPQNVAVWTQNTAEVLAQLDPANAPGYEARAEAYTADLDTLAADVEALLTAVAVENRKLVTNHDTFAYLAAAYDYEVVGTIIPGTSTLAEPSATSLAALADRMADAGVCTLFTEATLNDQLAQTVADELSGCDTVQALVVYTGALGPVGSGADSYISMMRYNAQTITDGLSD